MGGLREVQSADDAKSLVGGIQSWVLRGLEALGVESKDIPRRPERLITEGTVKLGPPTFIGPNPCCADRTNQQYDSNTARMKCSKCRADLVIANGHA